MKAIDRIFKYIESKNIKPARFEKLVGLSNGYLGVQRKRKSDVGSEIISKILDYCKDMNPEWLIMGAGEMLKPQKEDKEYINIKNNKITGYNNNLSVGESYHEYKTEKKQNAYALEDTEMKKENEIMKIELNALKKENELLREMITILKSK